MITKICDYLKSIPGLNLALILGSDYPCVVTALLQLHDNVDEASDAALHSLAKSLVVLCQDPPTVEGIKTRGLTNC